MRVLMLMTDLQRGGLPLRMVRLAQRFPEYGIEPVVGCLSGPGPLTVDLENGRIAWFSCDARSPRDVGCLSRLARAVRRIKPNVIHAALFHANLAARLVGRLDARRPIITSTVTIEIERRWHRLFESLTAAASDVHVANAQCVADHLVRDLGFAADRLVVIPNALDLAAIERTPAVERCAMGLAEDAPLIAWAGRMDPVKDLPTWLAAVRCVQEHRPVQAVLLGDGPVRPALEKIVARGGLSNRVRFVGWTDNVVGWLRSADVFLFTSQTEGCPNALLEAMACQCPVIASDIPACAELIHNGLNGLLSPPGEAAAFGEAVIRLLDDGRLASRLAARGVESVKKRHDLRGIIGRWVALYRRVLESR